MQQTERTVAARDGADRRARRMRQRRQAAATSAARLRSGHAEQRRHVKLGLITKFPVDFYVTMSDAAKEWDTDHPERRADHSARQERHRRRRARSTRSSRWSPRASRASPSRRRARPCRPALQKAVDGGVKVVLLDNDMPDWDGKTSVVATDNLEGGVLAGQCSRSSLKPGDTVGRPRGCAPACPSLDDRVDGMQAGPGRPAQDRAAGSRPTATRTRASRRRRTLLTAHPDVTAIYGACGPPTLGAIQSIQRAGNKPTASARRLRRRPRRGQVDPRRHESRRRPVPGQDGRARRSAALDAVKGKTSSRPSTPARTMVTKENADRASRLSRGPRWQPREPVPPVHSDDAGHVDDREVRSQRSPRRQASTSRRPLPDLARASTARTR